MNIDYIFYFTLFSIYAVYSVKPRSCKTCRFFLPGTLAGKYEIGNYFGRCRKFGYVDIKTLEINYSYAHFLRADENQCGKQGKHYEENLDAPRTQ